MLVKAKQTMLGLLVLPLLSMGGMVFATPQAALAACNAGDKVTGINEGKDCAQGNGQQSGLKASIEIVTNTLLFIIGAVSVIMIILGGIKYTLSNGDSSQITSAKNTILYAVIGLVVALLAYAIVQFVLNAFVPSP